jgi:hypothetical protein
MDWQVEMSRALSLGNLDKPTLSFSIGRVSPEPSGIHETGHREFR